jgi:uncharacterized protein (TIGR03437 family)
MKRCIKACIVMYAVFSVLPLLRASAQIQIPQEAPAAFGNRPDDVADQEPPGSSELLSNANGTNDAFAGVGRFRSSLTCTAALIDPSGSGASDAKAWLLTAGHCISLEPYGVIRDQPLTAQVVFRFFADTPPADRVTVRTRATGWATMKGIDLALVELDATLGDLMSQGIRPFLLASSAPEAGRAVFWTGISGSPIPPQLQFVRLGRCALGHSVHLLEGPWIWNDDLSNNCPDLYAGASGSPLFDAETGAVIGVIGTTTLLNFQQGPDYDCQVNRPCVIRRGGTAMERDTSYAADVQGVVRCFDQTNALDLQRPGCPLDPGFQLTIQSGANEVRPEVDGKPATWDTMLKGTQLYYAYKHFRAGEDNCGSFRGYSTPILVADNPMISDPIGREDGYYFLCVIAGDTSSFDSSWQQPSHASIRFKRLDSQPPLVLVDYEIETLQNAYRLVFGTGGEGTSDLGIALEKRGPLSATDCADPSGYRVQLSIPDTIRPSDYPARICLKISDKAGNFAAPAVFDFGPPALLPNAVRNGASLVRAAVAPGSLFRVDSFNLTNVAESSATPVPVLAGVQMFILDGSGRLLPVPLTIAGPLFLQAVMPLDTSPGTATIIVQPPEGPALSQPVTISRTAPGLFSESGGPKGFASDSSGNVFPLVTCQGQACYATQLPVSSTQGGLDFVLYLTGFRARREPVRVRIGTHILRGVHLRPHAEFAGVEELHFHLPQDFPLRLYQAISVETPHGNSNYLWIYLE